MVRIGMFEKILKPKHKIIKFLMSKNASLPEMQNAAQMIIDRLKEYNVDTDRITLWPTTKDDPSGCDIYYPYGVIYIDQLLLKLKQ